VCGRSHFGARITPSNLPFASVSMDAEDLDEAADILADDAILADDEDLDQAAAILADDVPERRRLGLPVRSAATVVYARQCRLALTMKTKVEALTTQLDDYDDRFSEKNTSNNLTRNRNTQTTQTNNKQQTTN
jgi:hypothetical protein